MCVCARAWHLSKVSLTSCLNNGHGRCSQLLPSHSFILSLHSSTLQLFTHSFIPVVTYFLFFIHSLKLTIRSFIPINSLSHAITIVRHSFLLIQYFFTQSLKYTKIFLNMVVHLYLLTSSCIYCFKYAALIHSLYLGYFWNDFFIAFPFIHLSLFTRSL